MPVVTPRTLRTITRVAIVIVLTAVLVAVVGWLTRLVDMQVRTMSPTNPDIERSLALRTDFSDEAAWRATVAAIETAGGEFRSFVRFVSDPAHATMTPEQIVAFARREARTFIFVVDRLALTNPDRPILVVDAHDQPGRGFRVVPESMWSVENNLAIANMDFEEFATAAGPDGVFRGFPRR